MINNKLYSDYSHYTIIPIISNIPIIPIAYIKMKVFFVSAQCVMNLICKSPSSGFMYALVSNTAVTHDFLQFSVDPSLGMAGDEL